jgi:hypothetical protein
VHGQHSAEATYVIWTYGRRATEVGLSPSERMGPVRCPETSVNNYHTTPRNTPEYRRFQRS